MYLQKVPKILRKKKLLFVGFLSAADRSRDYIERGLRLFAIVLTGPSTPTVIEQHYTVPEKR
jgi:hypothetical protein